MDLGPAQQIVDIRCVDRHPLHVAAGDASSDLATELANLPLQLADTRLACIARDDLAQCRVAHGELLGCEPVLPHLAGHEISLGDLELDRKSTRLNSSHMSISYAVFCLKKKKKKENSKKKIATNT